MPEKCPVVNPMIKKNEFIPRDLVETKLVDWAQTLLRMENDPGEVHTCPVCGGKAHIEVEAYEAGGRKLVFKYGVRVVK